MTMRKSRIRVKRSYKRAMLQASKKQPQKIQHYRLNAVSTMKMHKTTVRVVSSLTIQNRASDQWKSRCWTYSMVYSSDLTRWRGSMNEETAVSRTPKKGTGAPGSSDRSTCPRFKGCSRVSLLYMRPNGSTPNFSHWSIL